MLGVVVQMVGPQQAGSFAPAVCPGAPGFRLERDTVLRAVHTLYDDQLRPYGRILRKRLGEQAQAIGAGAVDIDIRQLRDTCEACPWLSVQPEVGGDWSALLRTRAPTFVDVYSPSDLYPAELWHAAAEYFQGLGAEHMVLPG